MKRQNRHPCPQHRVNQTDGNEVEKRRLGHHRYNNLPSEALLDIIVKVKGARRERDAGLGEGFGQGVGDGVVSIDDGELRGLVEVVSAEADLEGRLDDGRLLRGAEGGVEVGKGAVDKGEGDVVNRGGAAKGEGDEAVAGVDEGVVARVAFGGGWVACVLGLEGGQVDAVDGRRGVEVEGVGVGLEGDVGWCPVDELVEARVPALRALVARCGRLAEVAGEVRVAVEGDGDVVAVGRVCVFGVDVAFLRNKGTFGRHGSGVRYVIDAV